VQAPTKTSIGLWGIEDQHLSSTIQKQQLFWIGNHFEADIRQNFADTLSKAIEQGYTKEMLADTLKDQFNDLANRSSHYWQGLAEHTALRIREFGRLQGYKKAKARLSHSGLDPEPWLWIPNPAAWMMPENTSKLLPPGSKMIRSNTTQR
jgi:hypothetical protein